jgi:1-acyl-sn-glycerol-3-phosphate acyltransferase
MSDRSSPALEPGRRERPARTWLDMGYGPRRFPGFRHALARFVARWLVQPFFRLRIEGLDRYPDGSCVVCFNHLGWIDPIVLLAVLPPDPPLYFFGPKELDMNVGAKNRLMRWAGNAVAYRPGNRDLVHAARTVDALMASRAALAIAGEGRIHVGEAAIWPLSSGPAFFALRSQVPIVPVAINGTSWLGFGRRIRIRIGEPVPTTGLDRRADTARVTAEVQARLAALVADFPEPLPPGPQWQRITEMFNDWPEGPRPPVPMRDTEHLF